jgi:hypothetical protein
LHDGSNLELLPLAARFDSAARYHSRMTKTTPVIVLALAVASCETRQQTEERLKMEIEQETKKVELELNQRIIDEAIAQYQIVARAGLKQEMCLRAGVVVEAHLSAKQEEDWRIWKQIQYRDCKKAGVPIEKP